MGVNDIWSVEPNDSKVYLIADMAWVWRKDIMINITRDMLESILNAKTNNTDYYIQVSIDGQEQKVMAKDIYTLQ